MGIHKESKNKKGMVPKMVCRFCDPRTDRTAGEEDDDFEQTSSLVDRKMPRNKAVEEKRA